jgi:hypothetical protein
MFMRPAGRRMAVPDGSLPDGLAGALILVLILCLGLFPSSLLTVIGGALPLLVFP